MVIYECEIWSTTKCDNNKLTIFERSVLRNIFSPVYNTKQWKKKEWRLVQAVWETKFNKLLYLRIKRIFWTRIENWKWCTKKPPNWNYTQAKTTRYRPQTRCKDAVEKNIWTVDKNVSVEQALDMDRWRELLVEDQVLQEP